ncbi:MAG: COX15/CtaA family protein [Oceanococcaceae bacterium]
MSSRMFAGCARATLLLCLGVVILGAYVRLSDAGLGCPDWPGCYGRILVPEAHVAEAHADHAVRPLEADKAWKEMIHRYFASGVGLGILLLLLLGWKQRLAPRGLLLGLFGLVCFQGILGMWTVTWQLKPLAVSAHLIGGMATLGLLTWLNLRHVGSAPAAAAPARGLRWFAGLGLLVLFAQIFLGGWTSSNYAALACPDFPTCHASWWPESDFAEAFVMWRGLEQNYEYGVLDSPARTAIHVTHRLGAIVAGLFLLSLAWVLARQRDWRPWGWALGLGVVLQIGLGISAVLFGLPLLVATGHNAGAALLVMLLAGVNARMGRTAHG